MRIGREMVAALGALALAGAATAHAQAPAAPEQEMLKSGVGTWDATVEMATPGGAPAVSKGVETSALVGGWLITDFKSDMEGQAFVGHGIMGFDSAKKKVVSTWVDSTMTTLTISDSTYDASAKTLTGWMDAADPTGKPTKYKMITEWKDPDTRLFTIWSPGPDGKDWAGLKITYKRRK
jgi:hypothetical protein